MIIYLSVVGILLAAMGLVGLFFSSDITLQLLSGIFTLAGLFLFVIAFRVRPEK